jgi:hypothetical protein
MSSKAYNRREDHKLAFAFMPAASAKISPAFSSVVHSKKRLAQLLGTLPS